MKKKMKKSYLIQRLKFPFPDNSINPFSFGGGIKNGGMNKEFMKEISKILRFDQMGAAEFEYGAVPESFDRIIQNINNYKIGTCIIPYYYRTFGKNEEKIGNKRVYYLCKIKDEQEIKERLKNWAIEDTYLKEDMGLNRSLAGTVDCSGWFDIENDFMFFSDEKMWRNVSNFLGIKTPSKKKISKL